MIKVVQNEKFLGWFERGFKVGDLKIGELEGVIQYFWS